MVIFTDKGGTMETPQSNFKTAEFVFNMEMEQTTQIIKVKLVDDNGKSENGMFTIRINGQPDINKLQSEIDKRIIHLAKEAFAKDSMEKIEHIKRTGFLNSQRFIKTISAYAYDSNGVLHEYLIQFKDPLSIVNNDMIELVIKADCVKGQMLFADEELSIDSDGILVITPKNNKRRKS